MKHIIPYTHHHVVNEGVSDHVYHFTGLRSLLDILRTNNFILSNMLMNGYDAVAGKEFFYISLSRSKSPYLGYAASTVTGVTTTFKKSSFYSVRIHLNGRKLNSTFKSAPFDYYNTKDLNKVKERIPDEQEAIKKMMIEFEHEDRVYSSKPVIPGFDRYINSIAVYAAGGGEIGDNPTIRKIIALTTERGIPLHVYNDYDDMAYDRVANALDLSDIIPDNPSETDKQEDPATYGIVPFLCAALFIDTPYQYHEYDVIESRLRTFATKHRLPDEVMESTFHTHELHRQISYNPMNVNDIKLTFGGMMRRLRDKETSESMHLMYVIAKVFKSHRVIKVDEFFALKVHGARPKHWGKVNTANWVLHNVELGSEVDTAQPLGSFEGFRFRSDYRIITIPNDAMYYIDRMCKDGSTIQSFMQHMLNSYTVEMCEVVFKSISGDRIILKRKDTV
jgi:hypothetical protein